MKKILIIRFKQIGDALVSSPLCSSLKRAFPEAQIDYVLYEHISPLFMHHPDIDNVISIKRQEQKNVLRYWKQAIQVNKEEYDCIIDLMSTFQSEIFCLFGLKTKIRIGREKKGKRFRGLFYTDKMIDNKNEWRVINLQSCLGILEDYFDKKIELVTDYHIYLNNVEITAMRDKFSQAGIDLNKPIFAVAINSRRDYKVWPEDFMKSLIQHCIDVYKVQVVLFYSQDEKDYALSMHQKLNYHPMVYSNIITNTTREFAALISLCDFFTGNEGGPRHIAQAVDTPSFVICSPTTNKKAWIAENHQHQAIEPSDVGGDSYQDIKPLDVTKRLDAMLDDLNILS